MNRKMDYNKHVIKIPSLRICNMYSVCIFSVILCVGVTLISGDEIIDESEEERPIIKNCPALCFCYEERVYCDRLLLKSPPTKYPKFTQYLTLKNNRLKKINRQAFRGLKYLRYLLLSHNQISWIYPGSFWRTSQLLSLSLLNNKIKKLPSRAFHGLVNLQVLALMHNQLVNIHNIFKPLRSVRLLNLGSNRIRAIRNHTFKSNIRLQYLDLRNNSIEHIEREAFFGLQFLKMVIIRNNRLKVVDLSFRPGQHIDYLDFAHCQLTSIPSGLPTTLGDLTLSNNNITLVKRTDLNTTMEMNMLDLNDNGLTEIERYAFFSMHKMVDIHLKGNLLKKVPGVPRTIIGIYMNGNQIEKLTSRDLSQYRSLEYLMLRENRIKSVDQKAFRNVKKLKGLYLNKNRISNLGPMTFNALKELENLDLSENPLTVVAPLSFYGLKNVHMLRMASVQPRILDPRIFRDFANLVYLDFSRSPRLVDLFLKQPGALAAFRSVQDLNLMEANMSVLPSEFPMHFPLLRVVKLSGNPWNCDMTALWLAKWIRTNHVDFFAKDFIQCGSPSGLQGFPLKKLYITEIVQHLETTTLAPPTSPPTSQVNTTAPGGKSKFKVPIIKIKQGKKELGRSNETAKPTKAEIREKIRREKAQRKKRLDKLYKKRRWKTMNVLKKRGFKIVRRDGNGTAIQSVPRAAVTGFSKTSKPPTNGNTEKEQSIDDNSGEETT